MFHTFVLAKILNLCRFTFTNVFSLVYLIHPLVSNFVSNKTVQLKNGYFFMFLDFFFIDQTIKIVKTPKRKKDTLIMKESLVAD